MQTNFKQIIVRDKKHLEFIRKLNCCVCSCWPSEACHVRAGLSGGIGMKPPDSFVIPMCHSCHFTQHNIGEKKFWGDTDKPKELANALWLMTSNLEKAKERIVLFRKTIRT
jgi:hypothetical protein